MPLSKYPIEIPLGGAVDEGNVPEIVQPPRIREAEDCVSLKGGGYQKRDSYEPPESADSDSYAVQTAGEGTYIANPDTVERREGTVSAESQVHPGARLDARSTVVGDSPQVQWWHDSAESDGVIGCVWSETGCTLPGNKSNIGVPLATPRDVPPGGWSSTLQGVAPTQGNARLGARVWFATFDAATGEQLIEAKDVTRFGEVFSVPDSAADQNAPFALMPRIRAVPGTSLWCLGANGVPQSGRLPWGPLAAYADGDYGLLNGNLNMGYRIWLVDSNGEYQNAEVDLDGDRETLFEVLYIDEDLYALTYRDNNTITAAGGRVAANDAEYVIRQWSGMDSPGAPVLSSSIVRTLDTDTVAVPPAPASGAVNALPAGMYAFLSGVTTRLYVVLSSGLIEIFDVDPVAFFGASASLVPIMAAMGCEPIRTRGLPTATPGGVLPGEAWQWFPTTMDCLNGWTGPSSFVAPTLAAGERWIGIQCQRMVDFPGGLPTTDPSADAASGVGLWSWYDGYKPPGDPGSPERTEWEYAQSAGGVPYSVPVVLHAIAQGDLLVADPTTAGVTVGSRIATDGALLNGEGVVGLYTPAPAGAISSYVYTRPAEAEESGRVAVDAQLPSFALVRRVAAGGAPADGDCAAARAVALATHAELAANPGTVVHNYCAHKHSLYLDSSSERHVTTVDTFGARLDRAVFDPTWAAPLQAGLLSSQISFTTGTPTPAPYNEQGPYLKADFTALTRGAGSLLSWSYTPAIPKAATADRALFGGTCAFGAAGAAATAAAPFLQQWVRWPRLQRPSWEQDPNVGLYPGWDQGFVLVEPVPMGSGAFDDVQWDMQVTSHVVWYDESPAEHRSTPWGGFFPGGQYNGNATVSPPAGPFRAMEVHYDPIPWELMGLPFEQQMGTEVYVAQLGPDDALAPTPVEIGVTPLPLLPAEGPAQTLVSRGAGALRGSGKVLYTDPGELAAGPLPGVRQLTATTTRVWGLGMPDRNRVFYSKLARSGYATEWNGNLYIDVASSEPVTAIGGLPDGRMLFFTAHSVFYSLGEGPSDTGLGAGFSQPALLSDDVGCGDANTLATGDFGVMFRGDRGFYVVDRQLALKFVGLPYEDSTEGPVVATSVDGIRSEVMFYRGSPSPTGAFVYNYLRDQWSTFTAPWNPARDATSRDGRPLILANPSPGVDASLYAPTLLPADAAGVPSALQSLATGWLAMGKIQGYGRTWEVQLTGIRDPGSLSGLRVEIYYDYIDTPLETYDFDDVGSGQFKVRFRPRKQKSEAISFRFSEYVPATVAPDDCTGWRLDMCTVLAGVKAGLDKVAVTVRSS
ncbi:MAG: hypothetical protein GY772_21000 [bacterium]|nr:hypothetical protein [bacterium]